LNKPNIPVAVQNENHSSQKDCFWLAPLHGITYYFYRNILFHHSAGIEKVITPFFPAQLFDKLNVKKWIDLTSEKNPFLPVIPQLMGNDPQAMVDTVLALQDLFGFKSINWNVGCPMNQIVRKQRGCGLMPHPETIESVVKAITQKTNISFSVKLRLGLKDPKEGLEIINILNDYPLESVIIHPRLGIQQYDGVVDLDQFEKMYQLTEHQVVYNGDIVDIDSFQKIKNRFPDIHEWMIGRGILRNPFLVEELQKGERLAPTVRIDRFNKFYADIIKSYYALRGDQSALPKLKELWKYMATFCGLSDVQLKGLLQINDVREFEKAVSRLLMC
jgi:tRNA-dihydrouridine synthase B